MFILLLAFFAQAITSVPSEAPTFDEEFHVARAYAYVRTGDLRMQQNHPPLVSVIAGLPLLLMPELTPPQQISHWDDAFLFYFADNMFWRLGHDVDKMLFLARFPIILLGTLLGAFVYRWAREAYGPRAGLLAMGLYAFAPNLLAHTRLVTTDLAVTACSFIALYAFWRASRQPTGWRLILAGLALGLALSAKLSALLLIPVLALLALLNLRQFPTPLRHCSLFIGSLFIAGVVVWTFYRFEVRPWPGTAFPLPATTYLLNVRTLIGHAERGHGAFLMGQVSMHGWWYYFPVTFLLKTPLLTLLLLGVATWDTIRRNLWRKEAPLVLFPAAYFCFALTSSLDIGYRYLLPIDPFLIAYAAKGAGLTWLRPAWFRRYVLPAWLVLYAATMVWLHPHYLAYFNLVAGGPGGGYRYLVDSNLDWGQDLKRLKVYLDKQGVGQVWLGYFGTADPAYYGIQYRSLFAPGSSDVSEDFSPINPAPGWYAISATALQGTFSPEPDIFDWLRRHKPAAKIGYSILVYRVEPDPDPPAWLGYCYAPELVMADDEITRRFGRDDAGRRGSTRLRIVGFDCGQTWVYPAGDRPGWYLVPAAHDGPGSLAEQALGDAQVVYRERGLRDVPGYTVYRWRGEPALEQFAPVQEAWSSPVLAPTETDPVTALRLPVDMEGQVAFLGYHFSPKVIVQDDAGCTKVIVTTAWQVTARVKDPVLSIFAHLVSPTEAVSVGDGLGFPAIQWTPGDMFVQRNTLPVSEVPAGRYWTQVGIYSLATGKRLAVLEADVPVADRLLLAPIKVRRGD